MIKLETPLRITTGKKKIKKYSISLNIYRNLHYQVNNNLKKLYKKIVKDQLLPLGKIKLEPPIGLTLIYYNPTHRKSDLENFCSIQNKYLQDALVELGVIEEDNYEYIKDIRYRYGGYSKNIEKVTVEVYEKKEQQQEIADFVGSIEKYFKKSNAPEASKIIKEFLEDKIL